MVIPVIFLSSLITKGAEPATPTRSFCSGADALTEAKQRAARCEAGTKSSGSLRDRQTDEEVGTPPPPLA